MASSPQLKIFNPAGDYIGCMKHYEDAAMVVAAYGDGAQVRYGHSKKYTVWTEGSEELSAAASYDGAGAIMADRVRGFYDRGR